MNLKPSKLLYLISVGFVLVGFIVMIVLSVKLYNESTESIEELMYNYTTYDIKKDDVLLIFIEESAVVLLMDECTDNKVCITTALGESEFSVDSQIDTETYDFVTPYSIETFDTVDHECIFGILAYEDMELRVRQSVGTETLYISTFSYDSYSAYGSYVVFVIFGGLLGAIISWALVFSKRSKAKKEYLARGPIQEEVLDNPFDEMDYYQEEPKDYNDF